MSKRIRKAYSTVRKAYSARRCDLTRRQLSPRSQRLGTRVPYDWQKFVQEIKLLLPDVFYSDYYVMWLTELELSFLLMKYGHELQFFEIDNICSSRGLTPDDPEGKKYWRGLGA